MLMTMLMPMPSADLLPCIQALAGLRQLHKTCWFMGTVASQVLGSGAAKWRMSMAMPSKAASLIFLFMFLRQQINELSSSGSFRCVCWERGGWGVSCHGGKVAGTSMIARRNAGRDWVCCQHTNWYIALFVYLPCVWD